MIGKKIKYEICDENKYSQETGTILDKVLEMEPKVSWKCNYHVYLVKNEDGKINIVKPQKIINIFDDN